MALAPAVAAVRHAVRAALADALDDGALHDDGGVLVACSGGADSLALAAATAFVAPRVGVRAGLVTVDHGLQPGSAAQAARVVAVAYELGLDPVETVRVHVGTAGGPEAAARTARYAALDTAAAALDAHVLLGHTLDDQAETVLLGLGRGSGPRSLAGMAARDGRYLRPLLALRRTTTEAACAALGLEPWSDPHNVDPAFTRVRLRTEALPLLEGVLRGGVAEALARTAQLLRDDTAALDAWAADALHVATRPDPMISAGTSDNRGSGRDHHGAGVPLEIGPLAALPRAVRTRVLRRWAAAAGAAPLGFEHTAALDALITRWHGQGPIPLPGGVAVRRASGTLVASPEPPARQE